MPLLPIECPACGSNKVQEEFTTQRFIYRHGSSDVEIQAQVPLLNCQSCELSFTDERGEDARHDAVCRFLNLLCPSEIVTIRRKHGLSQSELAQLTRFGEASIKRWESGTVIQNPSADQFLRLLNLPGVVEYLRRREGVQSQSNAGADKKPIRHPKFRNPVALKTISEAATFKLRSAN